MTNYKCQPKKIEKKIINEMMSLCGLSGCDNGWTIRKAAKYVSGEDGILIARQDPNAWVKLSSESIRKTYSYYLKF